MSANRSACVLSVSALLVCGVSALAQDGRPGAPDQDPSSEGSNGWDLARRTGVEFKLTGGYTAQADLDEGDVSVGRLDAKLSTRTQLDNRTGLSVQFGAEHSFYDFADVGPFGVGGGVDSAAQYDFGFVVNQRVDDRWGWFAGASVTASPGEGADFGDSLTYGGFGGFSYQVSSRFRTGLGVGVSSRLEDNARVIPIPTLEWQIDERWTLGTVDRALRIRGFELSYDANEWLTLFALGGWASRDFRLDEDSGPAPDGVLRDQRIPLYIGATITPAERVQLDFGVGSAVWSEYELLDADGNEITDSDADPALSGWVGATIRF